MPTGFFPGLDATARPALFTPGVTGSSSRIPEAGTQRGGNGLERLEVIAPNEGPALDARLRSEIGGIQDIADRVGEEDAVLRAKELAGRAAENDKAQFERATRSFDLSDRQRRVAGRRQTISRSINRASAAGTTRRGFTDRAKAAEAVGGSFSDAFFGQRISGETALASSFTAEQSAKVQEDAAKKSSTIGTIGSLIGGAIAFFSSEDLKHDYGHEPQLLKKLKNVRVNRWQYKGDDKTHVGPFSEEFNKEFGIDTDRPDMINVIDALGVTMGAIKELDKKVEARG